MIPVREFSSAAEVMANARAVGERLGKSYGRPVVVQMHSATMIKAVIEAREKARQEHERKLQLELSSARAMRERQLKMELAFMAATFFARGIRDAMRPEAEPFCTLPKYIPMREVMRFVVKASPYQLEELIVDRRQAPLVRWRQIMAWAMIALSGRSYPAVGRFLGGRDHTTILHSFRKIEAIRKASNIVVDRANWTDTIHAIIDATAKGRGLE